MLDVLLRSLFLISLSTSVRFFSFATMSFGRGDTSWTCINSFGDYHVTITPHPQKYLNTILVPISIVSLIVNKLFNYCKPYCKQNREGDVNLPQYTHHSTNPIRLWDSWHYEYQLFFCVLPADEYHSDSFVHRLVHWTLLQFIVVQLETLFS